MTTYVALLLLVIFAASFGSAEKCMTCDSRQGSAETCKYGGQYKINPDECPEGKSTCYRMRFSSEGVVVYKRGCDGPNFCNEQDRNGDIKISRCQQCNGYYCNTGSLAF